MYKCNMNFININLFKVLRFVFSISLKHVYLLLWGAFWEWNYIMCGEKTSAAGINDLLFKTPLKQTVVYKQLCYIRLYPFRKWLVERSQSWRKTQPFFVCTCPKLRAFHLVTLCHICFSCIFFSYIRTRKKLKYRNSLV